MGDSFEELGRRIGALVDVKNKAYGSAFDDAGDFLRLLYPDGIQPGQYGDALCLVRIFDKMKRIATDRDALGESPYQDIGGYSLLGLRRVERERSMEAQEMDPVEEVSAKRTMGESMEIQNENPMFPSLTECNKDPDETQRVSLTKGGLSPDEHVRIPGPGGFAAGLKAHQEMYKKERGWKK